MLVTSKEDSKAVADSQNHAGSALTDLKRKLFHITNDRAVLAPYLMSPVVEITNPE